MSLEWVLWLVAGLAVGAVLGVAFFGGLMWTTRRLATAARPALLLTASLFVRLTLVALGFVLVTLVSPLALLGAVVGLVGCRLLLTRPAVIDRWFGPLGMGEADG